MDIREPCGYQDILHDLPDCDTVIDQKDGYVFGNCGYIHMASPLVKRNGHKIQE